MAGVPLQTMRLVAAALAAASMLAAVRAADEAPSAPEETTEASLMDANALPSFSGKAALLSTFQEEGGLAAAGVSFHQQASNSAHHALIGILLCAVEPKRQQRLCGAKGCCHSV